MTHPAERIYGNRTLQWDPTHNARLLRAAGTGRLLAIHHGDDFTAARRHLRAIPITAGERYHYTRYHLTAAARELAAALRLAFHR